MTARLTLPLLATSLIACGTGPASPAAPTPSPAADTSDAADAGTARVTVLEFAPSQVPPEVRYDGKLVGGLSFTDARGHNLVVFSAIDRQHRATGETQFGFGDEVTSSYLYAQHYVRASGGYRLVRRVAQADENCDGDSATRFRLDSFSVTDLDADGVGEIGFGYFCEGCRTDVSPSVFKLFLLEDGTKFVVRGPSHFPSMGDPPGQATSREGLDGAPRAFADHLDERWPVLSSEE